MVLHHWTRWLPCPYMVKTLENLLLRNLKKVWGWILVYSIRDPRSTKFVQMMILGWSFTFLGHCQISVLVAVEILEECCMGSANMQWWANCGPWASCFKLWSYLWPFYSIVKFIFYLLWQYWKNVAWHLQICNGCFTQVSESWPMGFLFVINA